MVSLVNFTKHLRNKRYQFSIICYKKIEAEGTLPSLLDEGSITLIPNQKGKLQTNISQEHSFCGSGIQEHLS